MAELLLDSAIRFWVFLPLVIITFLFGVIRHYLTILLTSEKKSELQTIGERYSLTLYYFLCHALLRSRLLRENGRYISKQGFKMRKFYFNDKDQGYFKTSRRDTPMKNIVTDPSMLTDMLKNNILNVIPMLVIGGWINWAFTGFLTTKIPFPLTYRFKPMLQRGCETLTSLDASWYFCLLTISSFFRVSSASWYFLNIFGLRSMYGLVLGADNAADQSRLMQEQVAPSSQAPQDTQKAFKAEWEALEMVNHQWALERIESRLLDRR
ncbi:unnamed protein product [Protopolystoma xenopodis]|uniref:ER membrane protein complex subunit 3 n=1 Tax=Protopolystoma xenopodis TaxID=117903 RepID=A0A448X5B5_9PLAT|nr:unnamed protein product [Protopolystoma xenopodis]